MKSDEAVILQRLYEHESVITPTAPSVSRCASDITKFLNAYISEDATTDIKRLLSLQTLDDMRFLLERLPQLKACLENDLRLFINSQQEARESIDSFQLERDQLTKQIAKAFQTLKEMNEIECKSIEVNTYSSRVDIQKEIEKTQHHISHLESETQRLKVKMEEDSEKLHAIYLSFIKLKNEILGIEVHEEVEEADEIEDDEGKMEIDE